MSESPTRRKNFGTSSGKRKLQKAQEYQCEEGDQDAPNCEFPIKGYSGTF